MAVSAAVAGLLHRGAAPEGSAPGAAAPGPAAHSTLERLEDRVLMAGDAGAVQVLPFVLDFSAPRAATMADKDGEGTGFTYVQPNRLSNEYQPALIDLRPAEGILYLTTTGTSAAGGPWEGDNTLVNGLQTGFDARAGTFTISVRLKGPLANFDVANEQAGLYFGPDQDNYIKLVAVVQAVTNGTTTAQVPYLQFIDEQKTVVNNVTTYSHTNSTSGSLTNVGPFTSIDTLDLVISGDATTGKLTAYYAINGEPMRKLGQEIPLTGSKKTAFFASAAKAGLIAMHKNDAGPLTVGFDRFAITSGTPAAGRPVVTDTNPAAGATDVRRDVFVDANVRLPTAGKGIDLATLTDGSVRLFRSRDGALVPAHLNTSGGGDSITLRPTVLLDANTEYTFEVTEGLRDTGGAAFLPFAISFTTGRQVTPVDPTIAFEKVSLPGTQGQQYTGLTIGPDGKLYASTITGLIYRFGMNADGTLSSPQVINTVQGGNGGLQRMVTGIRFDPASTAGNLVLWVSHGEYALLDAVDFTGKVSRLSGANLETYQDFVVNLPRSVRDHLTNQMDFGPDGALYVSQASNSSMGAPDNAWGTRPERLLSGAILRLDTALATNRIVAGQGALDVRTADGGGSYDPWAAGAPLTIYATGVRNAYDLIWHSNGRLYAPTNGSAAHGATPGYPNAVTPTRRIDQDVNGPYDGTVVPAVADVLMTEPDYLFRVEAGGYYGHPNPVRGEYVLNGGNPTAGVDPLELDQYPVGTLPDRNYRKDAVYVMGRKLSPNGVVEYRGPAFGGALNGRLLVARFAGGDDVVALRLGADGNVVDEPLTTINGLTGFVDPLDIVVDPTTGNLYVSEYDEKGTSGARRLTLLRPIPPGANVSVEQTRMFFNDVRGGSQSPSETLVVRNTGTAPLSIGSLQLSGADAASFVVTLPAGMTLPLTIPAGGVLNVNVAFKAASTATFAVKTATLEVRSNDPDQSLIPVALRGLPTAGTGGANEPSLQRLMDLFQIPINVGDPNPDTTDLFNPATGEALQSTADQVEMQRLVKAGPGEVTVEPLAVFGVSSTPALRFGWYSAGSQHDKHQLFTVDRSDAQSVSPTFIGATSFDPGGATFGVYSSWPGFANDEVHSEDALNVEELVAANMRKVRFYRLRNPDGSVVPDAYVMAHEEFFNHPDGAYDNQDLVAIVRNVRPAPAGPEVGTENPDGVPFHDRLVFNRIQIQPPDEKNQWDPVQQKFIRVRPPNNVVHDTAAVRIRNTGTAPLTVHSLVLDNPAWELVNPPAAGTQVPAGGWLDVTVRFIATSIPADQNERRENQTVGALDGTTRYTDGGAWNGTLAIRTDDADEPVTVIQLAGWWQLKSELNQEPSLPVLVNRIFGYGTQTLYAGQTLNQGGQVGTVGEEVLSPYWQRADASRPVSVRQLVAFHSQGTTETVKRHAKGSATVTNIFTHEDTEGQSLLPHLTDNFAAPAAGTFSTSGLFGFKIQSSWSDDALNVQEQPGGNFGHKIRFFPVRDRAGNVVPDAWLMVHDYYSADPSTGVMNSNFDYQDNIYLVTNVRPGVDVPTGLATSSGPGGVVLDWADNAEPALGGYNVYRRVGTSGTFLKINGSPVAVSQFVDPTAAVGTSYEYRVTAVSSYGAESGQTASVTAVRTVDTLPPVAPTGLAGAGEPMGVRLGWAANGEIDMSGYRVYRSAALDGVFSRVSGDGLVKATSYLDPTAGAGQTWFYKVTAVDVWGNESPLSEAAAAERPAEDLPPAAPAGLTVATSYAGISLRWGASLEADFAGYNVYRGTPGGADFVRLNGSMLTTGAFDDTAAAAGRLWEYRVTAVDFGGHESAPADVSATRPVPGAPTINLTAPADVDEGSVFQLTLGTVAYSGTGQVQKYVVHWGDGAVEEFTTNGVKTHVYADGTAVRDLVVDLFDGATTFAAAGTVRIGVNDVAPDLALVGQSQLPVGGSLDLSVSAFDPGDDTLGDWLIDWGDGTTETAPAGDRTLRHRYDRGGSYTVSARVSNEDGTFSSTPIELRVTDNGAPTPAVDALPAITQRGTAAYTFTVTYTDDVEMADVFAGSVRVTGPNGFATDAVVVSVSGTGRTRTVKYAVNPPGGLWEAADNGTYTVLLTGGTVADAAGNAMAGRTLGTFEVQAPAAPAGTTPATAIDLGTIGRRGRRSARESVNPADKPEMYYRLTVTESVRLYGSLGGLRGNADLELFDATGATRLAQSANPAKRGEKFNLLAAPGTYLIRVTWNAAAPAPRVTTTPFKLTLLGKALPRKVLAAAVAAGILPAP